MMMMMVMMMMMCSRQEDKPRCLWFSPQRFMVDQQTFRIRTIADADSTGVQPAPGSD